MMWATETCGRAMGLPDSPIWYPNQPVSHSRLPDGSLLLPDGGILPYAASCPPNTSAVPPNDPAYGTCVPFEGARNINFECGGLLAPFGIPGCDVARSVFASALPRDAFAVESIDNPLYRPFSAPCGGWPGDAAAAVGGPGAARPWLCLGVAGFLGLVAVGILTEGGRR